MAVITHIGTSRTATTTLQKSLFPEIKSNLLVTKKAYKSSIKQQSPGKVISTRPDIKEHLTYYSKNKDDIGGLARDLIFPLSILATKYSEQAPDLFEYLVESIVLLLNHGRDYKNIFISSEMLSETGASISCRSSNKQGPFPIFILGQAIKIATSEPPLISLCLRDPIPHLVSKFNRCCLQRRQLNYRSITPSEYIEKQIHLESSQLNASSISTVLHKDFLNQLQRIGYIKSFGFQQLKSSQDVFSLIGLPCEKIVPFHHLPVENSSKHGIKDEFLIKSHIQDTLKELGYLTKVMDNKIFE